MTSALPAWVPARSRIVGKVGRAAAVGVTLYVLDGSEVYAATTAGAYLLLQLLLTTTESAVGDYAGNAAFGLIVLGATGYVATLTAPWWLLTTGALLGGWFLFDGVQHLRHGVSRQGVAVDYGHDRGPLSGLAKALLARLVEPFRL